MNILAVETTGKYGSAAVIRGDGEIFSSSSSNEMNHLRDIITLCDEALKLAGIGKDELDYAAASEGPGSFTGIRIGVTSARTLAQVLGIRCVGVSSLEALAERAAEAAAQSGCGYVAAVINARRHQTYAGVWKVSCPEASAGQGGYVLEPFMEERQYMIEELLDLLRDRGACPADKVFFTGDGIDAYEEIIRASEDAGCYVHAGEEIRYQDAASVAKLALRNVLEGRDTDVEGLLPEYMRLSEAEQRLRAGTLSDKIRKVTGKM